MQTLTIPRNRLPKDGVLAFVSGGAHYLVADIDGDVTAFAVHGPVAADLQRTAIAEGHVRCPRHGWPIDARGGACGAGPHCRYEPVPVEADATEIRLRP